MFVQLQFFTTSKRKVSGACRWKLLSQVYSKQKLLETGVQVFIVIKSYLSKNYPALTMKPLKEILEKGDSKEYSRVTVLKYYS